MSTRINCKYRCLAGLRFAIFGILLCRQTILAQSFQPCVIKEYNEELAKTPLPGVEVSADDTGQRVSDAQGKLTLRFLTKNVGDHVEGVEIAKLGYEIFNTDAIAQWNISGENRPFTIVMCKSERFKKIKDNYNAISSKSYDAQKRKEEKLLEEERRKGNLKEADYKRKLQELQDEFDARSSSVRPYIDHFARIDLSELSSQERSIIELVKSGQIDSAINCYKRMHLEELFKENRNSYHKLSEGVQLLEEAKKHSNELRDSIFAQIRRKNDVLMMQGGKENIALVEKSYKEIADNDTTYLYGLGAYSNFLGDHHRQRENLRYLHLIAECGEREYHHYLGGMNYSIAFAHFVLNEYDKAKAYLSKSLDANDKYNKKDSEEYLHNLSNYYILMAQIYNREDESQNAETASEKGLEYTQRLYALDKKNATTLKMALILAITYNQNKPDSAIQAMNKLHKELLSSSDASENEDDWTLDILFGTLGRVNQLLSQGKTTQAKRQIKDAISSLKPLYEKDEQKYGSPLNMFYFMLGSLYYSEHDYTNAQNYLEKGHQLWKLEYETNHDAQTMEPIIMGLMMLGDIKSEFGYREVADSLYESALMQCDLMSRTEPYKPDAMKSTILSSVYEHCMRYDDIDAAIRALEDKVQMDSLVQINIPDSCSPPGEWHGRFELAKLYYKRERFAEAKAVLVPCMIVYSDDVTPEQLVEAEYLFTDLLIKLENYEGALQFMKYADYIDYKNDIRLLYYQAICHHALGKDKKARKIWKSIRDKLPENIYNNSSLKQLYD